MTNLIGFSNLGSDNGKNTMSSKAISDITSKLHSNVMQDIRTLIDQLGVEVNGLKFQLVEYLDAKGEKRPMYELGRKETLLLASGYNAVLRLKIINRLEELETIKIPSNFIEAMELATITLKQNQTLLLENSEMKPKADFFDQVTGSADCFDMADVAKVCNLGVGRNTLFLFLRESMILRENNTPYQQYVDSGHFRVIESKYNKPNGDICINLKTVVYQKGIDFIIKRYVGKNLKNK